MTAREKFALRDTRRSSKLSISFAEGLSLGAATLDRARDAKSYRHLFEEVERNALSQFDQAIIYS